jgi:flavin reductase (DIM6/NTAB) family NADH-FMN oxidoreductase RutF
VDTALVNALTWKIPNALALVGSRAGDEWNAMTTSWITQLSMEPVLIGVGIDNAAVTHRLISEGGSFTINLWSADDTKAFVKFSKPATRERREDGRWALNGRVIAEAPSGAPIFDEAVAWMDCAVRHAFDLGTHTLFVAELTAGEVSDDTARVAAMSDTRMKYGGVKRH